MSQVSTYVESQEGVWYQNPVIRRPDWFICWDDDEPIELVIAHPGPWLETVMQELWAAGWEVEKTGRSDRSGAHRCFTADLSDDMRPARAYFLKQHNGPPDALLAGNVALGRTRPDRQGVYYFTDMEES